MSLNKDELKAKLLAKAEAAIDQLMMDERLHEQMTLSDIERLTGEPEATFRQAVLEELMDVQEEPATTCPECGGKLRNKGKRGKTVVTVRGEAKVERNYYQCQQCGTGHFPPG